MPGNFHDFLSHGGIFLDGLGGAVDHDGGEAQLQSFHADAKVGAMVQMDGNRDRNLVCAPLGHFYEPVMAGISAGCHIVSQNDGRLQFLRSLADGPDDVVAATLGVDSRNGVAFLRRLLQLCQIVSKHSRNSPLHSCVYFPI